MGPRIRPASLMIAAAIVAAMAGSARAQAQASGLQATSSTSGSISIGDPTSITVTQNLSFTVLPSVNTGLTVSSSAANGVNANVTLTTNQAASISVPATFEVTRVGGTETVTVRTVGQVTNLINTSGATQILGVANGDVFSNPVTVVGNIDSGVLSFSVGGQVTLANNLVPGEYQGVLTVIAQYN